MNHHSNGYKAIADYAIIGNLRTAALVGRDGGIDWCCFPHLDRPSVFAALLDARRGGRFRVAPVDAPWGEQHYVESTNVLQTRFQASEGRLSVTDLMPLEGDIHGCGRSQAPPEIHRILHCEGGPVEVAVEWSPRLDYARAQTRLERAGWQWLALAGADRLSLGGLEVGEIRDRGFGPVLEARFRMQPGEWRVLVCRWGAGEAGARLEDALGACRRTEAIWREWTHREAVIGNYDWAGPWRPLVIRSALALKLLIHADTGAIAAAPTTSLPETIGGVRNWDYRYTWIRDGAMTAQALVALGHATEAFELLNWMEAVSAAHYEEDWSLQIMYGLHGETELTEEELGHFEGYQGSRPVRIGNGAASQLQLEIYGELLNTGFELAHRGERLSEPILRFLGKVADHVSAVWRQPDHGIWEVRGRPQHFTYSKAMCWVALDRGLQLHECCGMPGAADQWRRSMETIRRQVLEEGIDRKRGCFVQAYGSSDLDAANLRLPLLEFLPAKDPRVQATIDHTLRELTEKGLVYRYLNEDGLPGKEGTFGLCTFWLVDALALSGRLEEAWAIFDRMRAHANHVGLFPEQFDPASGEFLGNFPQAFTHIGLINSAIYLAHAEGRPLPERAPLGSLAHRRSLGREAA